jgi:hypothetical protein
MCYFTLVSLRYGTPELNKRENNFTRKTDFWGESFWALLDVRVMDLLKSAGKNCASFDTLAENFEELFFFNSY